jgi:hypothetical protein
VGVRGDAGENAKDGKCCVVCGSSLPPSLGVKPRKYCSRRCQRAAEGRPLKPATVACVTCGAGVPQDSRASGRSRRYCSEACRRAAKRKKRVHDRTCCGCGASFVGLINSMFCSEKCHYPSRFAEKACKCCGKNFIPGRSRSLFCSRPCAEKAISEAQGKRAEASKRRAKRRQCLCCQKPFRKRTSGRNAGKYCSRECAFEARRLRLPCARLTSRPGATLDEQIAVWFSSWGNDACTPLNVGINSGGHKRRCVKYGCHYESFPAKSILHRDNWTCQICQCELLPKWTKIDGSETPHPRSPTIDHIVPLSYGPSGPGHRPDNVQAACWACNIKKSDSFAGPLPTVQYS